MTLDDIKAEIPDDYWDRGNQTVKCPICANPYRVNAAMIDIDTPAIRKRVEKNYQLGLDIIKARDQLVIDL